MSSMAFMLSATLFAPVQSAPCQDLQSLSLPDAMITSVELVPAGPYVTQGFGGQQQTGPMLPEHCRVAATRQCSGSIGPVCCCPPNPCVT